MRIDLFLISAFEFITDPFGIRRRMEERKFNAFLKRMEKLSASFDEALLRGDSHECERILIRMKWEKP